MTFDATVSAGTLQDHLAPVSALVDECTIRLGPDGLQIKALDPAQVAMVEARLYDDAFESYSTTEDIIGVDLTRLEDVVGFGDSGDLVHLDLDAETRKLDVDVGALDYTFALINPNTVRDWPDIPSLDLPATAVLEGGDLQTMAAAADMVSDHITLGYAPDVPAVYSDAEGDTDDSRITFDADGAIDLAGDGASSLHSLDYIKDVTTVMPDEAEVTVDLGTEQPVRFQYSIAEGYGTVETVVSPRIAGGGE